jgi:hypothetical protein
MARRNKLIAGLIGSRSHLGEPSDNGDRPLRTGVSNLGALGGDGASTTRPTRRWGGITGRSLVDTSTDIEYLIVGGGGGGGNGRGGGGGAGGLLTGTANYSGSFTLTVGVGGTGAESTTTQGINGSNSEALDLTAIGGGGGGSTGDADNVYRGNSGGSGGGSALWPATKAATDQQGTAGQGNDGAVNPLGWSNVPGGGGGGGAGAAGGSPTISPAAAAGAGGAGLSSSITGSSLTYAAGGGGGGHPSSTPVTAGGAGVSGVSGSGSTGGAGASAPANRGGGGGGGAGDGGNFYNGGSGGSGVVILRYPSTSTLSIPSSLTYTQDDSTVEGFTITTFTGGTGTVGVSGTIDQLVTLDPNDIRNMSTLPGTSTNLGSGSLSLENYQFNDGSDVRYQGTAFSTLGKSSGKWYVEFRGVGRPGFGLYDGVRNSNDLNHQNYSNQVNQRPAINGLGRLFTPHSSDLYRWGTDAEGGYPTSFSNNTTQFKAVNTNYGTGWSSGDIVGMAFDLDNGTVEYFLNGTSQGEAFSDLLSSYSSGNEWYVAVSDVSDADTYTYVNFGQPNGATFGGTETPTQTFTDSNGNGEFYHQPPAGFKVLATYTDILHKTGVLSLAEHYQSKP